MGEARRLAASLARRVGFSEKQLADLSLVVTEMGSNLAQHAFQGELLMGQVKAKNQFGLELIALDRGPGMADVGQCLRDGYSTAGTSGNGLGAIQRLSQTFDIHSIRGVGTFLLARLWTGKFSEGPLRLPVGAVSVAKPGESICGDNWAVRLRSGRISVLVVDGLGHGRGAAEASEEAVECFLQSNDPPESVFSGMHSALRKTRGAAVAIAEFEGADPQVSFCGVGNIVGALVSGKTRLGMVSAHGIVGVELPRLRCFGYSWKEYPILILHSDGVSSRWQLEDYPGIARQDPSLIAGLLYRDFRRGRDDVTIVVVRLREAAAMLSAQPDSNHA